MKSRRCLGWAVLLACVLLGACKERTPATALSLRDAGSALPAAEVASGVEQPVRIAVGAMITPHAGYGYYSQFLEYVEKKLGREVVLVDRETYAEVNNLMKSGDIDAAFVCGKPYVQGHDEFGMELLVAPQVGGETVYYSYTIVSADSDAQSLEDLRGKKFAFTDPMSNSGMLSPTYWLGQMGETPESFFSSTVYTHAHDKSIRAVADGMVDGAAVDHLIWIYGKHSNPEMTARTRVVHKSQPFGIPPVVVRPGLLPELKNRLRDIFLTAHEDQEGLRILQGMMIERFVELDDSAYDSIREMERWAARTQKK